jgi:hypothetical protein
MGRAGGMAGFWRGVSLTLVVFALAVKVFVPPGYMVASHAGAFGLAICTGHGPLIIGNHGDPKAPGPKTSDAPCAFAGSATPPAPPTVAVVSQPLAAVFRQAAAVESVDQAPGRGLAAPPPRSHAPPILPEMT